jgi:hypothetical protein
MGLVGLGEMSSKKVARAKSPKIGTSANTSLVEEMKSIEGAHRNVLYPNHRSH